MGNVASFLNLTKDMPPNRKYWIIFREMLIALGAMLLFNAIGEVLFDVLGFSETALRLASGLILFLIAFKILFAGKDYIRSNLPAGEPFIFPLAIPLLSGPGLLATIMLYSHLEPSQPMMLAAILIAWLAASAVLLLSPYLYRFLGQNGLTAAERLMGMILVLLAIQRFADGVQMFLTGKC